MQIVATRRGVEIIVTGIAQTLVVRPHRTFALRHGLRVVAAQRIDERQNILQMARIRREAAQHIGRLRRALRKGRHLQGVNVHMEKAGMGCAGPARSIRSIQ